MKISEAVKKYKSFIPLILLIPLLLVVIIGRMTVDLPPKEFSTFDELDEYVSNQSDVEGIELIVENDYEEFNVYLLEKTTNRFVDEAMYNYIVSPNVFNKIKGKYVVINFYYDGQIIRKDKTNVLSSTDGVKWKVEKQ